MADILLIAGITTTTVGAIQGGRAAAAQAKSEQRIADYNALVMEREAKAIEQKTRFDLRRHAEHARRTKGKLVTKLAGSGAVMGEGTTLALEDEQIAEMELENMLIGYEGGRYAAKARAKGALDTISGRAARLRGKSARTASYYQAGGSLLTGFGQASQAGYFDRDYYLAKKHGII